MIDLLGVTFEQCAKDVPGKAYADWEDEEYRCLIIRGPGSLCGYIGVNEDHPLYGVEYDNLPIECHGGLTFSDKGDDTFRPAGRWWFGWDYGHAGDASFYDLISPYGISYNQHKWTPSEVESEFWHIAWQFKKLTWLVRSLKQA